MTRQTLLQCKLTGLGEIALGQDLAAPCIFQSQQFGFGKVCVIGFDGRFNVAQCQAAVGLLREGLRLHTAKHRRATPFPAIAMGHLAHDVFITTLAM